MFENILNLIKEYDTIIIHRHSKPDGDALGSQVGLMNIIKDNFNNKTVYMVGDMTERYKFIAENEMDEISDEVYNNALAIVLDTSASHLISDERYKLAKVTARIDHHIFVEKICDEEVTDTSFESCCGLIAYFAKEQGLKLSPLSAKALYTGMVTDSGRFHYDSTTSQTFLMAAFLMEQKFDTNDIYKNLYADELSSVQLRAKFALKIQTTPHRVAFIYTTKEEVEELGVDTFTISRGMVGVMSDIKGFDSWVNFTETEDGVLCELRSNRYNINPIAVKYGGGGHKKASGACVKDKETAFKMLEDLNALSEEE